MSKFDEGTKDEKPALGGEDNDLALVEYNDEREPNDDLAEGMSPRESNKNWENTRFVLKLKSVRRRVMMMWGVCVL